MAINKWINILFVGKTNSSHLFGDFRHIFAQLFYRVFVDTLE